jgi:PDZ domain-containing protein
MTRLRPGPVAAVGGIAVAVVAAVVALLLVPSGSYIFLPDKAHAVAPLVSVAGGKPPKDGGGIYFVDVFVRKASLLERLWPGIHAGAALHPASDVQPPGVSDAARRRADLQAMSRSQQVAAAVALRALGYKVSAKPTGALVEDVAPDAPAAGKVQAGDVIVSLDGSPVRAPRDLRRLIHRHRAGDVVHVGVRRGADSRVLDVRTVADPTGGGPIIGVIVDQAADIKLPRRVAINSGSIGGPSAGLPFALDVMEELGRDVDHGLRVAATGQIELDGSVLPIGGVQQKTVGARQSNVDVFLVPAGDNAREAKRYADGLRVVPVTSFQQALRALATIGAAHQQ